MPAEGTLAEAASQPTVAETSSGPLVFEVSAFGAFRGLHEATGINAAELLAGHVVESLSRE